MKNRTWLVAVLGLFLTISLSSCGPSFVGVQAGPAWGPGPGYWGARPFYGYRALPPRAFYRRPYTYCPPPRYNYRFNGPRYGGGWNRGRRW